MTLASLYDDLEKLDWFYEFADDPGAYNRGCDEMIRLTAIAKDHEGGEELLQKFKDHHFTGGAWGGEQQPKPERPEC